MSAMTNARIYGDRQSLVKRALTRLSLRQLEAALQKLCDIDKTAKGVMQAMPGWSFRGYVLDLPKCVDAKRAKRKKTSIISFMDIKDYMQKMGAEARKASRNMASASTNTKNQALTILPTLFCAKICAANRKQSRLGQARANGLDAAMLDRLTLTRKNPSTPWQKVCCKLQPCQILLAK